jgi:hypothetical protein
MPIDGEVNATLGWRRLHSSRRSVIHRSRRHDGYLVAACKLLTPTADACHVLSLRSFDAGVMSLPPRGGLEPHLRWT